MQNVRVAKRKRPHIHMCKHACTYVYICIYIYIYMHIFTHVHIHSNVRGCCVGSLKMILSQAHAQKACAVTHVLCMCAGRSHDSYLMCFCPRLKGLLPLQCHESMRALELYHTHILHRWASLPHAHSQEAVALANSRRCFRRHT